MTIFDLILLAILVILAAAGFWAGFIRTLGHVAAFIAGLILAINYYNFLAAWLMQHLGGSLTLYRIISFILVFGVVNRVIIFIFWLLEKIVVVSLFGIINRLIGAALGLIGGILILGLILPLLGVLPWTQALGSLINNSSVATALIRAARLLWPLLPAAFTSLPF